MIIGLQKDWTGLCSLLVPYIPLLSFFSLGCGRIAVGVRIASGLVRLYMYKFCYGLDVVLP